MVSASSSVGFLKESPVISAPSAADKRLTVGRIDPSFDMNPP